MKLRYAATILLAALIVAQALAATITRNPTSFTTPDPGQGGLIVGTPSNTGHGNTTATANSGNTTTRTCIWSGFAAAPVGQIRSVKLKLDWSETGSLGLESNEFTVQYSTNGGASWATVFSHFNINANNSGSSEVTLPNSQDLTQVRVRDKIEAVSTGTSVAVTGAVSNIRIEVVTVDPAPIVMQ